MPKHAKTWTHDSVFMAVLQSMSVGPCVSTPEDPPVKFTCDSDNDIDKTKMKLVINNNHSNTNDDDAGDADDYAAAAADDDDKT